MTILAALQEYPLWLLPSRQVYMMSCRYVSRT